MLGPGDRRGVGPAEPSGGRLEVRHRDNTTLLEHDGRTLLALAVLDFAVARLTPNAPAAVGTVKRAVTVVCAAFNELASVYSASASARTCCACAEVGRISTSSVAASPDAVEPAHSLP